jgi:hypothetical protein
MKKREQKNLHAVKKRTSFSDEFFNYNYFNNICVLYVFELMNGVNIRLHTTYEKKPTCIFIWVQIDIVQNQKENRPAYTE